MIKTKTKLILMSICIFVAFMLSSFAIITGNSIGTYAEHEGLVISQEKYNKNPLASNVVESSTMLASSSERSKNEVTILGSNTSYANTEVTIFAAVWFLIYGARDYTVKWSGTIKSNADAAVNGAKSFRVI